MRQLTVFLAVFLGLVTLGCSDSVRSQLDEQSAGSGSIVLARPMPETRAVGPLSMFGFLPASLSQAGSWVQIDTQAKKLSLMDGDKVVFEAAADGADHLAPGKYQVLHKQRSALWYAPDAYFTSRSLPVPPEGDRARFRRGALGDFAIFLGKDLPVHSGPVWSSEIGGVRLEEAEISRLYYSIDVGGAVEVK